MFPLTDVAQDIPTWCCNSFITERIDPQSRPTIQFKTNNQRCPPIPRKSNGRILQKYIVPSTTVPADYRADLSTFARHAGRKAIEEGDVQMLLQRSLHYIS